MQWEKLKSDSLSWRITEMDRYLGAVLQWLNSAILIIWMIFKGVSGTGILLEKYHTLSGNFKIFGQAAGILLAAFLMVYFLFGVGAFLTGQYGLGRRMMCITGISVLGTGVIWWKSEISVAALVQVVGIFLVIMGIYFIQIYSNNKAQKSISDFKGKEDK